MHPWKGFLALTVLLLASYRSFSQANGGPCSATGNERLQATSYRYQPGQTVSVSGSGYQPSCNLNIAVSGPASGGALATTDASGQLAFSYQLGSALGEYTIGTYLGDETAPQTSTV